MHKDYYFYFDEDGMPLAVFLTATKEKAKYLFSRLYKNAPEKIKSSIMKESDVPFERWEEIHRSYGQVKKDIWEKSVPIIKLLKRVAVPEQEMVLESSRYMRK